jgi:ketosteroid isomerase-like protein
MTGGPNTERLLEGIGAFNRGDHEAVLAQLTEDVEWKRVDGLPDQGGVIHGRQAVRELLRPEAFAAAHFEPLEIVEAGDTLLVRGRFHARGAGSGIELGVEAYVVYWFEGGLVRQVENWRRREDAERSSGLQFDRRPSPGS